MSAWLADSNEPSPGRGGLSSLEGNAFLDSYCLSLSDVTLPLEQIDPMADVQDVFNPLVTPEASKCSAVPSRPNTVEGIRSPSSTASHHPSDGGNLLCDFTTLGESSTTLAPSWSRYMGMTSAPCHDQTGSIFSDPQHQEYKAMDSGITACVELGAHLEARQREGPRAVDEMLATNREAATKINQLIVLDELTLSSTSSVILTTAAEHIVSLFEIIVRSKPYDQCTTPCVGFGTFLIDPEEQKALRIRIVSKELRLNAEMLRRLSRAITQRRGSIQDKLKKWLQELEQRIENLISIVENE